MADSSDNLFKLAEKAAPREDRLMPAERTYLKSSKTVDVMEALSLMKKRKKNKSLIIEGGLDDESSRVRLRRTENDVSSVNEDTPTGEVIVNPTSALSDLAAGADSYEAPLAHNETSPDKKTVKKPRYRKATPDIIEAISSVKHDISVLAKGLFDMQSSLPKKEANDVDSEDVLSMFKMGSHKVTFLFNGMEITVKCLNMTLDERSHCLVLAFDAECESFFVPPLRSELSIRYDDVARSGKLYYFGMDFTIKPLGVRFLGFLYDESSQDTSQS